MSRLTSRSTSRLTPLTNLLATWLLVFGLPQSMALAAVPQDSMAQRVKACATCHGQEGRATNSGYFPRIAGKPAGYLYNQLINFRDGRRHNPTMTYLLAQMSDQYLQEIANHFASLELPYPPAQTTKAPQATLARGEQLVRQGDVARGVPACAACHGSAMSGLAPAIPGLLGLPHDYLLGQLGAWRNDVRRATAPDCMGEIARQLSPQDVSAVATWLSSQNVLQPVLQPVRQKVAPAGSLPTKPAMECGSGFR